jgi:hypothetical protein
VARFSKNFSKDSGGRNSRGKKTQLFSVKKICDSREKQADQNKKY